MVDEPSLAAGCDAWLEAQAPTATAASAPL
jgi:hypothetical protein